jgi:hypothetical protein
MIVLEVPSDKSPILVLDLAKNMPFLLIILKSATSVSSSKVAGLSTTAAFGVKTREPAQAA